MKVRVAIACNDRFGNFSGQFDTAEFNSLDEFDCLIDGEPLNLYVEGDHLYIEDLDTRFAFTERTPFHGNTAWDSFELSEDGARRLFQLLISKQWVVTEYVHGGMFDDLIEEANT